MTSNLTPTTTEKAPAPQGGAGKQSLLQWRRKQALAQRQQTLREARWAYERAAHEQWREVREAATVILAVARKMGLHRGAVPQEFQWAYFVGKANSRLVTGGGGKLQVEVRKDCRLSSPPGTRAPASESLPERVTTLPVAERFLRASTWEVAAYTRRKLRQAKREDKLREATTLRTQVTTLEGQLQELQEKLTQAQGAYQKLARWEEDRSQRMLAD